MCLKSIQSLCDSLLSDLSTASAVIFTAYIFLSIPCQPGSAVWSFFSLHLFSNRTFCYVPDDQSVTQTAVLSTDKKSKHTPTARGKSSADLTVASSAAILLREMGSPFMLLLDTLVSKSCFMVDC